MHRAFRVRTRGERGQALVEYGFIIVLVVTVAIAVIIMAGNQLKGLYNQVEYQFSHLTDTTVTSPCSGGENQQGNFQCNN